MSALLIVILVQIHMLLAAANPIGEQPLARIAVEKTAYGITDQGFVKASPSVLGSTENQDVGWVTVDFGHPNPSNDDWIGVFSPSNFSAAFCSPESSRQFKPLLCTAPIKYQFANYSNSDYKSTGKGKLMLQLINQREDFSFALFSGGVNNPTLIAVSNTVEFANPKAPVYPRLAQGKSWDEMVVTWTSGYDISEAEPFVEWGRQTQQVDTRSPAGTLTFNRNSMCGAPARTVGWRDPGFIHSSFLKDLWPNARFTI